MQNEEKKTNNLQMKSKEVLMKTLNNVGIIGAILCAIADIVFVIIFVTGLQIEKKGKSLIIFSIINAIIGILINTLLRYQGKRYAELENDELCKRFYKKKVKEQKKTIPIEPWLVIKTIQDILIKGISTVFSIYGVVYISIEGSKNPIQILITLVTLILFACFGLINMNSAYNRFYNIQIPYMKIKLKEDDENGIV